MDQTPGRQDILIIGGGVIGICAAYYLTASGRSVTLLEKDDICAGASYGNAGLIVPSHAVPLPAPGVLSQGLKWLLNAESPFYVKPRPDLRLLQWLWKFLRHCREEPMRRAIPVLRDLGRASVALFEELVAACGIECGFEQKGWLLLFNSLPGLDAASREAGLLHEFGVESQVLDEAGVRRLQGNLTPAVVGGVYFPQEAHLVPDRFVRELAHRAESTGACLKTHTEVLHLEVSGTRISRVVTTRGNFEPDQVVLAAGAWSLHLACDIRLGLPVEAAKGYSITVQAADSPPALPLYLTERKVAVTPMGELVRFSGTLELAGLDLSVNRVRVAAIERAVHEYMAGLPELKPVEVWCGLRPVTPDGLPIVGRSKEVENLVVATGHGMLGITLGPITGKLVCQIVTGEPPALDLRPFKVDRF